MEVDQFTYRGTLTAAPYNQLSAVRNDRDRQLLEALRWREPTAGERLIATYGNRAYRLAIRITGNAPDAEEAVQDAFWSVIRKIDTFRGDSSLGSWIYRIVANAAYQKVRGQAHRRADISLDEVRPRFYAGGRRAEVIGDWSAWIDDPAARTELRAALDAAIEDLAPAYGIAIVLREVEGLSMREVAEALNISVGTAKSRAHRGRVFLRKRLAMSLGAGTIAGNASSQHTDLRELC
jgi:RNA polymerase sigma-70 factor (ECF subfamily)